jgi:hypothetical protein
MTPAMRTYATVLVSGALVPVAMGATMIVHGDGQAALVAFAGLTGGAFLVGVTRLLAIGERRAWPVRRGYGRRSGGRASIPTCSRSMRCG